MSSVDSTKKKGHPFLTFLLGLVFGVTGALVLPDYLPEGPWKGSSIQGTVLEKQRQEDRLLMRISTDQGLVLATFSQQRDDIDLLVQSGDQVRIRVRSFEPFVNDPLIENVMRPDLEAATVPPTGASRTKYVERLESQLAEWDAQIARLRRRAAATGDDARARSEELLGSLEEKSKAARKQLAELKQASGSAWEELKSGAERAWAELEGELAGADREIDAPPEKPPEDRPTSEPQSGSEGSPQEDADRSSPAGGGEDHPPG